jgi:hypothetical protein
VGLAGAYRTQCRRTASEQHGNPVTPPCVPHVAKVFPGSFLETSYLLATHAAASWDLDQEQSQHAHNSIRSIGQ